MCSGLSQPPCEKVGFVYARYFVQEVTAATIGGGNADTTYLLPQRRSLDPSARILGFLIDNNCR
jgi:hypothetical protein